MDTLCLYILYFFVYSFFGWIWEVIYFAVTEKRFSNGGVVAAPLLPIYGIGAVSILALVGPYVHNPFYVFVASVILASVVEFIGHWLLEKLFGVHLWDYRNEPFNLQGRICLVNSLGFGILSLAMLYVAQPAVESAVGLLPSFWANVAAIVLVILFVFDFANSAHGLSRLKLEPEVVASLDDMRKRLDKRIAHMRKSRAEMHKNLRSSLRVVFLKLDRLTVRRLSRRFPRAEIIKKRNKK